VILTVAAVYFHEYRFARLLVIGNEKWKILSLGCL
jgi:hypothetical protein